MTNERVRNAAEFGLSPGQMASKALFYRHKSRQWVMLVTAFMVVTAQWMLGASTAKARSHALEWPLISLQRIEGDFMRPVEVTSANDGTGRLFVLEREGRIYVIQDGKRQPTPFLNISDRVWAACTECGLLGIAFPPDFAQAGYFFVNYLSTTNQAMPDTGDPDTPYDTVIARFRITGDPNVADAASEERILAINQPGDVHNGGHMLFGPDGYLYIGMGDGGGPFGGDDYNNANDPDSLLGKILRIEVGATGTYRIPTDNPFREFHEYRGEVWAMGLRNPWRFTFDRITGDFYLADVGQAELEELNYIAAADLGKGGQNYGWPTLEGDICYPATKPQTCDRTGFTAPVLIYRHELDNCSIIGGVLYRSSMRDQAPVYLYGDFCTGRIWGLQWDGMALVSVLLYDAPFLISSFGEDEQGNLYVVSYEGEIYQISKAISLQYLPTLSKPFLTQNE